MALTNAANGQPIVCQTDTTYTVAKGTDFGTVTFGRGPVTHWFAFRSFGDMPLVFPQQLALTQTVPGPHAFALNDTQLLAVNAQGGLAPNTTVRFAISYTPLPTPITSSAGIGYYTNDPNNPICYFGFIGKAGESLCVIRRRWIHSVAHFLRSAFFAGSQLQLLGTANFSITPGATMASPESGTAFGLANIGGQNLTQRFTLANEGYTALNLSAVSLQSCSDPRAFSIAQQPGPRSLAVGASASLALAFHPPAVGGFQCTVSFTTSDAVYPSVTFVIAGVGQIGRMSSALLALLVCIDCCLSVRALQRRFA